MTVLEAIAKLDRLHEEISALVTAMSRMDSDELDNKFIIINDIKNDIKNDKVREAEQLKHLLEKTPLISTREL